MKSKRKNITTSIKDIVTYWQNKIDECELNVDWAEANERCWRCGYKRKLQRCHIIPDSLGGEDTPSNLVLLCDQCHKEAPNVQDSNFMWDWIKSYSAPFYDTFWKKQAYDEYEKIYHKNFIQELADRNIVTNRAFREFWNLKIGKSSFHFGNPYTNLSTSVGELKMRLDFFDIKHKNGKYKSDYLVQKEICFESFVDKICDFCIKNNWSVWEGSSRSPYSICVSAFYPTIQHHKAIAIRINRYNHYQLCYTTEWNPNNIPLSHYSIDLEKDANIAIKRIKSDILKLNEKYGIPSTDIYCFVSNPIWKHFN